MIIKKHYGDDEYIILEVTDIEYEKDTKRTNLIGKLIDEKGCGDFREFKELVLRMNENVEVIK